MAASGSLTTSSYKNISMMLSWVEKSQSIDDATTTIEWTLKGYRTDGATGYVTCGGFKVVIDGTTVYTKSTDYRVDVYNGTVVASGTLTINHGSDGTKKITVSVEAAIYYHAVNCSGSDTFTLTQIPRASEITTAGAVTLGNACNVKWTPKASSFYYKLVFKLGNLTETKTGIAPKKTSAYTYSGFTIPLSWASEVTTSNTGEATVTLTTHTASSCTSSNQVGAADSETFTVTVPENTSTQPTLSVTLEPVSALSSAFAGLYIQGKCKVKGTIAASGKYGATIKSTTMSVEGKSYDSGDNYTSDYLSQYGEITVTTVTKDSRGFSTTVTSKIPVIAYSKPQIIAASGESDVVAARCDNGGSLSDSGTYLKIKAKRSYSQVNSGGAQRNFCQIRYRYKLESATDYSSWTTILASNSLDSNEIITGALLGGVLALDRSYLVQVGVVDDIGGSSSTTVTVPTDKVYMHRDKNKRALAFGKYIEDANCIDIAEDITLRVRGPFEALFASTVDDMSGNTMDYLKLGAKITATAAKPVSLNNYKTPGNYYSPNADNSRYITDSPYTAGGFGLIVREIQTTSYIRQELFYGRTTWIRHWDGSSWSGWWRYLTTTEAETAASDYVIENGTKDGWTYKKWKGGTYQAFGIFEVTPTSSTINGSLYRTNNMTIDLPFAIKSAIVSGTAVGYYWITNGGISGTSAITLRLMSDKTFSTTTAIEVRLEVVGTYS